jgi:hypothetical protein
MAAAGPATIYELSDGSTFERGAGGGMFGQMQFAAVAREGDTIRYRMLAPDVVVQYDQYNQGNHSASYQLEGLGDIFIEAAHGGTLGYLEGEVLITADEPANYRDERFHYLSAEICSAVPLSSTIRLREGATFDEALFDSEFAYDADGVLDFTAARP